MNVEIRDREKTTRGFKSMDTSILKGLQIHHNLVRPHMGLDGAAPAERAGIKVEGENPWITLIQNATESTTLQSGDVPEDLTEPNPERLKEIRTPRGLKSLRLVWKLRCWEPPGRSAAPLFW